MRFITRLRIGIQSCDFVSYTEDATIVDQYVEKCCLSKMRRIPLKEHKLTTDIIIRIAQAEETSDLNKSSCADGEGRHNQIIQH